jgi:hypothetical protein
LTFEKYVVKNGRDALAQKGIQLVDKTLVTDMVKEVAYPDDKMEGLWIIDESHLGVLNRCVWLLEMKSVALWT